MDQKILNTSLGYSQSSTEYPDPTDLKKRIHQLETELEEKEDYIREIETKLFELKMSDTLKKPDVIENMHMSFDLSNLNLEERKSQATIGYQDQIDKMNEKLFKLKSKLELQANDLLAKNAVISQLKEENQTLKDRNKKWIAKLDDEIERNAEEVSTLTEKLSQQEKSLQQYQNMEKAGTPLGRTSASRSPKPGQLSKSPNARISTIDQKLVQDYILTIQQQEQKIKQLSKDIQSHKSMQRLLEEKLRQGFHQSQSVDTQLSKKDPRELIRDIEKLRNKLFLANSENGYLKKYKKENVELTQKIQQLQIEANGMPIPMISGDQFSDKYAKLKDKCYKLSKENDFYNQVIALLLTIKKVTEKELSYATAIMEQKFDTINKEKTIKRNIFDQARKTTSSSETMDEQQLKNCISECQTKKQLLDKKLIDLMAQLKTDKQSKTYNETNKDPISEIGFEMMFRTVQNQTPDKIASLTDRSNIIEFE